MINDSYKQLIRNLDIHFSEELGNNFLIDDDIIDKEYRCLNLKDNEIVLEIGAGIGTMIERVRKTNKIIAIEKDIKLFDYLNNKYEQDSNVVLMFGDFLDMFIPKFDVLFSNLPFHVADAILYKVAKVDFSRAVVSFPLSFLKKLTNPRSTLFLYLSQFFEIKEQMIIPSECFYPIPKTKIVCVRVDKKQNKITSVLRFDEMTVRNALHRAQVNLDLDLKDILDKQIKSLSFNELSKLIKTLSTS